MTPPVLSLSVGIGRTFTTKATLGKTLALSFERADANQDASRFLSTFAAAEQLYDALYTWNKIGSLRITNISLNFFKQFLPSAKTGSHKKTSQDYESVYQHFIDF